MYVILTNYVNWHRENFRSDRENTGNLKIQFEWVPCLSRLFPQCHELFMLLFHFSGVDEVSVRSDQRQCGLLRYYRKRKEYLKISEYEKSSDIRTCPMFWTLCPMYLTKTSDIMSEENIKIMR